MILNITNLHASIEEKEILKGITLQVKPGEIVAIMGPNGSGKSTLSATILGAPHINIDQGDISFDGESLLELSPDERAKKGIFLSFQHPFELPGITLKSLLRSAMNARFGRVPPAEFTQRLEAACATLKIPIAFVERYANDGFSGGEKKRAETLQLLLLEPRLAILDETDSGLDVDALKVVSEGIASAKTKENAFVVITHYTRILEYIAPDRVLILKGGRIVKEGGPELAKEIEAQGFEDEEH